jgi:catechol 2,3-dioxygenase-like lactoylglutathione lyase family enzyme
VVDLEAAEQFYAVVLGLPVVERWPHREAVWVLAGERTRIGLWKPQLGIARGGGVHVHFGLNLSETDYDSAVERVRSHGLPVHEELFHDRLDEQGRPTRAAFVTDPEGNVVELWTWDVARHLADGEPPK